MAEIVERVIMSKDIYRFRWRIENFSKLKRSQHSKTFFAGRHEWRVTLRFPKGHSGKCVSVKLDSDSSKAKTIPVAPPEVRLAFVDQLRETSTMLNFDDEPKLQDWCNDYAVLLVRIDNLPARGFLVNDTIIIEAEVSLGKTVSEAATGEENPIEIDQPREAILSSKTQDLLVSRLHNALRNLRTILVKEAGDGLGAGHIFLDSAMQRISKRIPRSKEELLEIEGITKAKVNKYGDRLLQTIEATVCDYYKTKQSGNSTGDSAKIKRNEGSRTKKIKPIQAINESLAEPLSTETQEPGISKGVDDPKVMHPGGEDHSKGNMGSTRLSKKVARTSNITSPCSSSVQLTSKNLLAQLSTVASNCKSTSVACDGSALLQQQREELAKFFKMSLEAICEANWFVKVQEVVLKISEFTTDPLEKTVVQDLLSRLVEFGNNIPQALSTIESCRSVETCSAQTTKELEGSLLQKQKQLTFLDSEVSRIEEEKMKAKAEIELLVALEDKLGNEKNSTVAELEAANREVLRELGELKRKRSEHKEALENRLRAKERLAQFNASWKLFKENLGL